MASNRSRKSTSPTDSAPGQILIYQDAGLNLQVRLDGQTVWLTQLQMADLFQTSKQNISLHIQNILADGELTEEATVKQYLTVQTEGEREVRRQVDHYNLEMILAVGYRVRSLRGTQFRQWATARLSELLVKGFTLDDERIKAGRTLGQDYFDELLSRIRDIRSSERLFYQKITDIYATSIDYDRNAELTEVFFKTAQNKLHWAAHGRTAAEVVRQRANAAQPHMGLTSWKNPTLVVVTDRNDLDGQLHGMFDMAAEVLGEKPVHADSRTALREQLNQRPSGGIVFTTIQKFVPGEDEDTYPKLTERDNVVVMCDEAHRSQYGLKEKNLAVEVLERLLRGQIKSRFGSNVVQSRKFSELLQDSLTRYRNRAIETAQVIEELIAMAKQFKAAANRGEELGLSRDEMAFYDALAANEASVRELGDATLRKIARELTEKLRASNSVDWYVRESVRAKLRLMVKTILKKYKYPPDGREQAKELSAAWATLGNL
jgi:hypothetical protein